MRACFSNAVTVDLALSLSADVGYLDLTDERLQGLLARIRRVANIDIGGNSYARVEERVQGHPWHHDTGTSRHMSWCRYTAGVLLTDPTTFDGGGFYFRDAPDSPVHHYLDLMVWDSAPENEHCVTSNSGGRKVLIMFFGESDE